jgi:ABC-type glycerol-3-phosphate transport system substrate-binding protein
MQSKIKFLALLPIFSIFLTACTLQDIPVIGPYLPEIGGSSSSETPKGPYTLLMWGMWEPASVYAPVIESYKQTNPDASVSYENRNLQDTLVEYKERVYNRASEGAADVMMVHNSWVPGMVARGLLAQVPQDVMSTEEFSNAYYPVAEDTSIVDGTLYAMPAYYDGLALVYNMDHFNAIGQSSAPTAWEEFRRIALQLNDPETGRAGAAMGASANIDHFSDILGVMWSQAGVRIPDDLDSTAAQDALTFYTNFINEDGVWDSTRPEAVTSFINGEVSMIFVPSWQVLRILESVEDPSSVGVAPVPQAITSDPVTWGTYWVYVVPVGSQKQGAAWDFVNYITQPEQVRSLYTQASKTRLFGAPYARVDMAGDLYDNDYIRPILDTAPYATISEISSMSGNRRQVEALDTAVTSVLSGTSEEAALITAKQEIVPPAVPAPTE